MTIANDLAMVMPENFRVDWSRSETIEIHHLVPSSHEVSHELLI